MTEGVPKAKRVIELLLSTCFCSTLTCFFSTDLESIGVAISLAVFDFKSRFYSALKSLRFCSRVAKRGGFKRGGFPIWACPSFFVLFCPFWDFPDFSGIFPICSGMVRGFSRFVPFLFLGLLRAPTRNSPERVRDTIWTFPEKSGKPPVWKPPGLASPNFTQGI